MVESGLALDGAVCLPQIAPMPEIDIKLRTKVEPKTERPKLHKVILVNDD